MSGIYALKPWFVTRLRSLEDILVARRVSPNALTFSAVATSALAGAVLVAGEGAPMLWLAILPLGIVRLALNALDGSVARRTNRATGLGTALNEIGDRACDLVLFAPLVALCPPWLVVTALALMTLTSTAGVIAQAVTGRRDTHGPMGKADRVLLLGLAALIAASTGSTGPFVAALVVVVAGCVITTVSRVARLSKEHDDVRQ